MYANIEEQEMTSTSSLSILVKMNLVSRNSIKVVELLNQLDLPLKITFNVYTHSCQAQSSGKKLRFEL